MDFHWKDNHRNLGVPLWPAPPSHPGLGINCLKFITLTNELKLTMNVELWPFPKNSDTTFLKFQMCQIFKYKIIGP